MLTNLYGIDLEQRKNLFPKQFANRLSNIDLKNGKLK